MVLKQGLRPLLLAALGRGTRMAVPTLSSQCGSGHQWNGYTRWIPSFRDKDMSLGIHDRSGAPFYLPVSGTYLLILVIAGLGG